jgi:hypothetical protein
VRVQQWHDDGAPYAVWMPLSGMLVVLVGLFVAATLALPTPSQYSTGPLAAGDVFRPEWLIAATLLAVPVYQLARRSWRAGLLAVLLASLQLFYIASTAVHHLEHEVPSGGAYAFWYVVAAVQIAIFVATFTVGAARDLKDRRWTRMMRKTYALPSPPRGSFTQPG